MEQKTYDASNAESQGLNCAQVKIVYKLQDRNKNGKPYNPTLLPVSQRPQKRKIQRKNKTEHTAQSYAAGYKNSALSNAK